MRRLLVVANDYPYPPHHGAAVDLWNRILGLKHLGFTLDMIATVRSQPKDEDLRAVKPIVENLWIIERKRGLSAALFLEPFQVRSRRGLRDVSLTEHYEAVLLQSEYVASVLENRYLKAKVRILRAENDEARFCRELAGSVDNWKEKLFYRLEALKFDLFSPRIKSRSDLIWFISDHEMKVHRRKYPKDASKAIFLPSDPGIKQMHPYQAGGQEVLFIGSLTLPPNVEGLKWYVENVHPGLCEAKEYSFVIAGRTSGSAPAIIKNLVDRYPKISLYPDPCELTNLYRRAAVFVNPVLRGAGVKVKTVHALHAGVPVVSTSVGMEGTGLIGGKHLLVADSASEFIRCVTALLQDRSRAEKLIDSAQSFLAETYDQEQNMRGSLSAVLPEPVGIAG